jgi:hypothetical protein
MAQNVLGTLLIRLEAQTSAFVKGMGDARTMAFDSSAAIVDSLKNIGTALTKLKFDNAAQWKKDFEIVGGVVGGVAIAAVGATIAVAKSVAEQGKEMSKLSQSYGLPIETVSSLRVASKLTGVSLETLTVGMGRLAKASATFATTGKDTTGAFTTLGLKVTDAAGHLRPMSALMEDVAEKFSKMENGTGKTALAMQLFGRSGAALIPFLNEGKAGIAEMTELSNRLGLTWSEKDLQAAEQLQHTVEILDLRTTAFKEQLAKAVIPSLNNLADAFTHADGQGQSLATGLGSAVGTVLIGIAKTAEAVATGFDLMYLHLVKLKNYAQQAVSVPGVSLAIQGIRGNKGSQLEAPDAIDAERKASENEDIDKQIAELHKQEDKFFSDLDAAQNPFPQRRQGRHRGDDGAVEEIDGLLEKVRSSLNTEGKDPLAAEISNIQHLRQELEDFRASHPERIWEDLNDAVNKLAAAEDHLKIKQAALITTAEIEGGPKKTIDSLLALPAATPTATGAVQQGAANIKLGQDAGARNQMGAQVYQQTRTAAEAFADTQAKLTTLLRDGNITQDEFNRGLELEKEKLTGTIDPAERYRKELEQIRQLHLAGKLDGTAYAAALKKGIDDLNKSLDEEKLRTGSAMDGMRVFFQQSQQMAESSAQRMHTALSSAFSGIQSSMSSGFSAMILGTESVSRAWAQMGANMLKSVVEALTQMVAKQIVLEVEGLVAHTAANQAKVASDTTAESQSTAISSAAALKKIMHSAAVAAAKAYESVSDIPVVGPFLAPVAAAAAFVGVMAFGAIASAAGGYDVPEDQMAMLHKDEKVLPARFKAGLENMSEFFRTAPSGGGGYGSPALALGGGGSSSGGDTNHYYGGDIHFHNVSSPKEAADLAVARVKAEFRSGGVIRK